VPGAPHHSRKLAQLTGGVRTTPLGLEHGRAKTTGSGCGARLALRGLNSNGNKIRREVLLNERQGAEGKVEWRAVFARPPPSAA